MNLFQTGTFTLRSGEVSVYKIECDALTDDDWDGLAVMAFQFLPQFCHAIGVPRGGLKFADSLNRVGKNFGNSTGNEVHPVLIAEDVVTTGGSMERFKESIERKDTLSTNLPGFIGISVFARKETWPDWVIPLFPLTLRRPRCPKFPKGEQCAMKWGHVGGCKWGRGD